MALYQHLQRGALHGSVTGCQFTIPIGFKDGTRLEGAGTRNFNTEKNGDEI